VDLVQLSAFLEATQPEPAGDPDTIPEEAEA